MRVGITGGTGFIGEYLIRDFCSEIDVVAPIIENPLDISGAEYVFSDYSVEDLLRIFEGCDAVIHLAAKVAKRNTMEMVLDDYIGNTVLTVNVFEACRRLGITNVVHASSRSIFDWSTGEMKRVSENSCAKPQNPYGVSKVCDEVIANYYNDIYHMNIKSFRMAEVCGFDLKHGLINAFWNAALRCCVEQRAIPVYGTGMAGRDLLYVKDAARAFVMGINQKEKKGVYNMGSGQLITNKEIADEFCNVFENNCGVELFPEKEEWGTNGVLDVQKAKEQIGFETRYMLKDIIMDIKAEYEKKMLMRK